MTERGIRSHGAYDTASSSDVAAPAANTAAVVTYAASPGESHLISGVAWSYSGAPTGGNLKIEDGSGNVIYSTDITGAGVNNVTFRPPKKGSSNTAMIISLAAGGAGITGKVSVLGHWKD